MAFLHAMSRVDECRLADDHAMAAATAAPIPESIPLSQSYYYAAQSAIRGQQHAGGIVSDGKGCLPAALMIDLLADALVTMSTNS